MPRCGTLTDPTRMPSLRPTARLKMPRPSYPGPCCHVAASAPRNAPGPRTRVWILMTLTLLLSLTSHLSMQTGGARPLFCAPHALRLLLASRPLPHWKCCTTRLRTSVSSFTSASPTSSAPTVLCAVHKLSNYAWSVLRAKNDRMRQRKRLAQQADPNPLATQPKSSPSQSHTLP